MNRAAENYYYLLYSGRISPSEKGAWTDTPSDYRGEKKEPTEPTKGERFFEMICKSPVTLVNYSMVLRALVKTARKFLYQTEFSQDGRVVFSISPRDADSISETISTLVTLGFLDRVASDLYSWTERADDL